MTDTWYNYIDFINLLRL